MATSSLTLDTGVLTIVRDVAASNSRELIAKRNIVAVMPTKFQSKADYTDPSAWKYRYDTMTIITIYLRDKGKLSIELQDLSNQPTWNGGTLADMNLAVDDINTWLPSVSYIQATGGTEIQIGDYRYHIFNSTDTFEVTALSSIPANNKLRVLAVAGGGGGGGYAYGGGGGAGAVTENLNYLLSTLGSIPVVVGAGGSGGTAINDITNQGSNGSDSSFLTLSRLGGGGGGGYTRTGSSGGNGGGGNGASNRGGGTGTQGFAGSAGQQITLTDYRGGGGGGANQIGQTSTTSKQGSNGGSGTLSTITNVYYGGGGAGGGGDNPGASVGIGGIGGGGGSSTALNAAPNTGGGGAGATFGPAVVGGNGGSGIVIIGYYYVDATGWDSHTDTVADRMTSLGSTPSEARFNKMNTLIKNLKGEGFFGTDNVWAVLDILQPYYAETAIQSLVEWKMKDGAGVYDATVQNGATFVANTGYDTSLSGVLSGILTNFAPSNGTNYTQNTACFGFFASNTITASTYACGCRGGSGLSNPNTWIRVSNVDTDQAINAVYASGNFSSLNAGFYLNNRDSSTQFKTIKNKTVISTIARNSSGRNTDKFLVGRANTDSLVVNPQLFIAGGNLEAYKNQLYDSLLAYMT